MMSLLWTNCQSKIHLKLENEGTLAEMKACFVERVMACHDPAGICSRGKDISGEERTSSTGA